MSLTEAHQQPRQHITKQSDKPALKVTGKLLQACLALVYEGKTWQEAAESVGYQKAAMLYHLRKPHVMAFIRAERDVLRSSMCGRNILVLAEVRDQTANQMARVNAVQALERIEDQSLTGPAHRAAPGLIIQIVQAPPSADVGMSVGIAAKVIEHE